MKYKKLRLMIVLVLLIVTTPFIVVYDYISGKIDEGFISYFNEIKECVNLVLSLIRKK